MLYKSFKKWHLICSLFENLIAGTPQIMRDRTKQQESKDEYLANMKKSFFYSILLFFQPMISHMGDKEETDFYLSRINRERQRRRKRGIDKVL